MCLRLEMLWVKKCYNLSGRKYFPVTVNIFLEPKTWNYFFFSFFFFFFITSLSGICENITDDVHKMK